MFAQVAVRRQAARKTSRIRLRNPLFMEGIFISGERANMLRTGNMEAQLSYLLRLTRGTLKWYEGACAVSTKL